MGGVTLYMVKGPDAVDHFIQYIQYEVRCDVGVEWYFFPLIIPPRLPKQAGQSRGEERRNGGLQ